MVKQMEDEIPLTYSSPSITEETRARFDALLNAALKEKEPPEVFKRSNVQTLLQKFETKSAVNSSENSQSSITSDRKKVDSINSQSKIREVSALVHSSRSNLLSSSEEDVMNTRNKRKSKASAKIIKTKRKTHQNIESVETVQLDYLKSNIDGVSEDQRSSSRLSKRSYTLEISTLPIEHIPVISSPVINTSSSRPSYKSVANEKQGSVENSPKSDLRCNETSSGIKLSSPKLKSGSVINHSQSLETLENKGINFSDEDLRNHNSESCVIEIEASEVENRIPDDERTLNCRLENSSCSSDQLEIKHFELPKTPVPLPRRKTLEKTNIIDSDLKEITSPTKSTRTSKYLTKTRNDSTSVDTDDIDETESNLRFKKKKRRRKSRTKEIRGEEIEMKSITPRQNNEPSAIISQEFQTSSTLREYYTGEKIAGITIHCCDYLKPDPTIKHPMVKVHIVDIISGEYLTKTCPQRPVCFFDENSDYILPIMTHPFDFKEQRTLLPQWEELLVFNEVLSHIAAASTLVLFEIMDFVSFALGSSRYRSLGSEGGWIKISWAFLKLIAANGANNLDRKLRLQLFYPKNKNRKNASPKSPPVYHWWSTGERKKYPGSLYVTVCGITPPQNALLPSLRSRVVLQQEQGSATSFGSVVSVVNSEHEKGTSDSYSQAAKEPDPIIWTRLPGQSCKLPNSHLHSLPSGSCGSMSIKFSHSGLHIVCGTNGNIYVYTVPGAKLYVTLSGHQGLVYSLRWSKEDRFLVSASADCTVCVWDIRHKKTTPVQVLPHPSFVYCADYIPGLGHRAIVTGCHDGVVRLWYQHSSTPYKLTEEAVGHSGSVNALCFTTDKKFIITGDSGGNIRSWCLQDTNLCVMHEIIVRELRGIIINNLIVHPGGNRLLVHSRDSMLRMVDISTGAVIQWFRGCMNEHLRTGCCLTECGGTVLACSEDGSVCAWDSNTGVQTALYMTMFTQGCISVDYHPHEHMAAFSCYSPSQYPPVLLTDYQRSVSGQCIGLKLLQPMDSQNEPEKVENIESIWNKLKNCEQETLSSNSVDSNNTNKPTIRRKKNHGKIQSMVDCVETASRKSVLPQLTAASEDCELHGVKDHRLLDIIRRMDKVLLAVKHSSQPE